MTVAGGGSVQASVTRTGFAVSSTSYERRTLCPFASSVVAALSSRYSRWVPSRAAPMFTRPQPWSVFGAAGIELPLPLSPPARSTAVFTRIALVSAGEGACGFTSRTYQSRSSAAAPATCGAACEVPDTSE